MYFAISMTSSFTGYKLICQFSFPAETAVHQKLLLAKSCHVNLQTIMQTVSAGSHFFSMTVLLEGRDRRHSWRKPNMTDSLGRKREMVD